MNQPTVDVLIVGAGPTGLALAIQLARYGVCCRIIDSALAQTDKSKALAIQARTLEVFATMGIVDAILAQGIRARGFSFHADGRSLGHARFTTNLDTPYPYVLLLAQSETERILIARLSDLGVSVERGVTLATFTHDDAGIHATLAHAHGESEDMRCRWLVGCDGAHSTVRHQLNIPFAGAAYADNYWLADLHVDWSLAHDEIQAFLDPRGFLFAFPISAMHRYRLIAQWDEAGTDNPTLADLQRLMDMIGPTGTILRDPVWLTAFRLHHRKVTRYRDGNVFLAGDAAHIHSPAGGQGMNTGIQDADNLAWKLALVAAGRADPMLLESYHIERSAVGAQVLRQTDLMFRAITVRSPVLRAVRDRLLPLLISRQIVVQQMQQMIGELGIHYRASSIVPANRLRGGPRVGSRAPNAPLVTVSGAPTGLWALFPSTQMPQHMLLLFGGPKPSAEGLTQLEAIRQMIEKDFRDTVAVRLIVAESGMATDTRWSNIWYDDPHLAAHTRYRVRGPALYLIRPDGYISLRSQPADGDALRAYLRHIFVPVTH